MAKKQFVVIGLGRFGWSLAKTLYSLGSDVLVIDKDEEKIESIADEVTCAVQADVMDETSIKAAGISNCDVAIISIGNNMEASVMATLLVKEAGVKFVISKAHNEVHAKILNKIGADKIIKPEKEMGIKLARNLVTSNMIDYIPLSGNYSIAEISPLDDWKGKSLRDLDFRKKFGINVIAIKAEEEKLNVSPGAEAVIKPKDIIIALGTKEDLDKFNNEK